MTIKEQQQTNLGKLLQFFEYDRDVVAEKLDVNKRTIAMWIQRGRISAVKAVIAEKETSGEITKKMLRPDVKDWMHEER